MFHVFCYVFDPQFLHDVPKFSIATPPTGIGALLEMISILSFRPINENRPIVNILAPRNISTPEMFAGKSSPQKQTVFCQP